MKYFLHDSNAFNDEKITQLYIRFGYEGLGLFFTCLEKFAQQEKPINTEVLKHQLHVGKKLNKCWWFMEQIGLLSSNNGETFNKQLLNFSETYKIKKEKNAKRISDWRDKQEDIKNVTCYESVSNTPKVKLSKVNRSKENKIFVIPTIEEISSYCLERKNGVNPRKFFNHYEAKGWYIGKNKMKDWRAAVHTWENNDKEETQTINFNNSYQSEKEAEQERLREISKKCVGVTYKDMERKQQ